MKCLICGVSEHDQWNSLMIPTAIKSLHVSFLICGSCAPLDMENVMEAIPPGEYDNARMQVLNV